MDCRASHWAAGDRGLRDSVSEVGDTISKWGANAGHGDCFLNRCADFHGYAGTKLHANLDRDRDH